MTTQLSSKGQLVIPKEVRDRLGWKPGTELNLETQGQSVILRPVYELPETSFEDLIGCVPYDGPPVSLAEMEEAIAEGARHSR
jgi:AbrB family looped-hinge helix DNA binding protein